MKKNIIVSILILILSLIIINSRAFSQEDVIEVYIDWNFPPYEYIDENNTPTGFNVELLKEIASVMNLNLDIKYGVWSEIRSKIENKEIDMLTGMYYSKERDEIVDFSNPHSIVNIGVFVKKDSNIKIETVEDLRGLSIVVQNDDIMEDYIRKNNITNKIIEVGSHPEALETLSKGDYDCAVVGSLQGFYYLEEYKLYNLRLASEIMDQQEYCFAFKEGDEELKSKINEGMAILKRTGRYRELQEKWFGVYDNNLQRAKIINYLRNRSFPIIFILVSILAWILSLKRQVKIKTNQVIEINKSLELKVFERTKNLEEALKDLKETQNQLVEAEKLIALNDIIAGVAHEINTPVGVCITANSYNADNLNEIFRKLNSGELKKQEFSKFLNDSMEIENLMDSNLKKIAEIVGKFKEIGISNLSKDKKIVNLKDKLLDPYNIIKNAYPNISSKYKINCSDDILLNVNPNLLFRILLQLIRNSFMHGYDESIEVLDIGIDVDLREDILRIEYWDNGKGIDAENIEKVFQPFFTTARDRGGTGLGLNMIYNAITNGNFGKVRCESIPYKKTSFIFEIYYRKDKIAYIDKNEKML